MDPSTPGRCPYSPSYPVERNSPDCTPQNTPSKNPFRCTTDPTIPLTHAQESHHGKRNAEGITDNTPTPVKNRRRTTTNTAGERYVPYNQHNPNRHSPPKQHTNNHTEYQISDTESCTTNDMYLEEDRTDRRDRNYADTDTPVDPSAGHNLQQLERSLHSLLNDAAVILDRLPENYMLDQTTQNACKTLFHRITGDAPVSILDSLNSLNRYITTELNCVNHSVSTMGEQLNNMNRTITSSHPHNTANQSRTYAHPTPQSPPNQVEKNKTSQTTKTQDKKCTVNPLNAHHPTCSTNTPGGTCTR